MPPILEPLEPHSLLQWVSHATLVGIAAYALWRGGAVERLAAAAMALAYVASPYAQAFTPLVAPQYGVLAIDAALLLILLTLALTSDRRWLLFATAAQGLGVMTHLAIIADAALWPRAYLTANIATAYLVLGALAIGAHLHGTRVSHLNNLYSRDRRSHDWT